MARPTRDRTRLPAARVGGMLIGMFFAHQITTKQLAGLCRRLGISLEAGIDVRTVWAREAERASGRAARARLELVSREIAAGESLADALADTGSFFPLLFREMAEVGEQTGHLDMVFAQLADHYQERLKLRRNFLAAISWPVAQLVIAICVVGLLIWIMGFIGQMTGSTIDILGMGLVGGQGLAIYLTFLAVVGTLLFLFVRAVSRGLVWTRPIQRFVLRIPWLGPPLQTVALARLAWTLNLTLDAGMEVRRALRLSLRSARNARFADQIAIIDAEISAGNSIHDAFSAAGSYPTDFLDSVHVGEQTGKLAESMDLLSRQYAQRAQTALGTLTMLAGLAVWGVIAMIIIALIFRIFGFYLGTINDALDMTK